LIHSRNHKRQNEKFEKYKGTGGNYKGDKRNLLGLKCKAFRIKKLRGSFLLILVKYGKFCKNERKLH